MAHQARKRFGQNFLEDETIIESIIASIQVEKEQHWVEIGPGLGALTQPLLRHKIVLDVIELDRDLVDFLNHKFTQYSHFNLYSADALTFDYQSLVGVHQKLRIIGNLPYNISTPLLFHLLKYSKVIADMHFMLQKEVVDRLCASPGSKKYGRLSVMMQYHCQSEKLFNVPATSFNPIPKVMSAIVRLIPHLHPPVNIPNLASLNKVVTQAFNQRRKTIRNSLKKLLTETEINALGINPKLRAEELSLPDFAILATFIYDAHKSRQIVTCDNLPHS